MPPDGHPHRAARSWVSANPCFCACMCEQQSGWKFVGTYRAPARRAQRSQNEGGLIVGSVNFTMTSPAAGLADARLKGRIRRGRRISPHSESGSR